VLLRKCWRTREIIEFAKRNSGFQLFTIFGNRKNRGFAHLEAKLGLKSLSFSPF